MPFGSDFQVLNNCSNAGAFSFTGFTNNGTSTNSVDGDASLILQTATTGANTVSFTVPTTTFRITENILGFWFNYSKGKGPPFLGDNSNDFTLRLYFGGNATNYAEWDLTTGGNSTLANGYQSFQIAGGSSWTRTSGTPDTSDWVTQVELFFDFANANNNSSELNIDAFYYGKEIRITSGTETLANLEAFSNGTGAPFPLGIVDVTPGFANIRCGLDIQNGAALEAFETYILLNQLAPDVKANLTLAGTLTLGQISNGQAIRGCTIAVPQDAYPNFNVNSGTLNAYNSKIFRFEEINFGEASADASTINLQNVDIDANKLVRFRAATNSILDVELHDNPTADGSTRAAVFDLPNGYSLTSDEFVLYNANIGAEILADLDIVGLRMQDNTTDFYINDPVLLRMKNGRYDPTKLIYGTVP